MALETTPWDPAERLTSREAIASYLEAIFEDRDPALIAAAFADVARASGLADTGVRPETLLALAHDGDPRLSSFIGVARALGLKLQRAA